MKQLQLYKMYIKHTLNGILKCGFHLAINIIIVRGRKKTMQTKILKRMKWEGNSRKLLFISISDLEMSTS